MSLPPIPQADTMIDTVALSDAPPNAEPITDAKVSFSLLQYLNALQAMGNNALNSVGSGNIGPAFRNPVVDGSFEVWDGSRSLSLPAANGYTGATMWSYASPVNFAQYTVSRIGGLVAGSQFALQYQRNLGSADVNTQFLLYDMETVDSIPFAGQQVALSFIANPGSTFSAAGGVLFSLIQTGTGVDQNQRTGYTGAQSILQANVLVPGSFKRYTQLATLPAGITQVGIGFAYTPTGVAGVSDSFRVDDVQFENSLYSTAFERLPWGVQRLRTHRYFWKTFPYDTTPAQNAGSTGAWALVQSTGAASNVGLITPFPVRMRAAPTVIGFNPGAANAQARDLSTLVDCTATGVSANDWDVAVTFVTAAGSAIGNINGLHITADARL